MKRREIYNLVFCYKLLPKDTRSFRLDIDLEHEDIKIQFNKSDLTYWQTVALTGLVENMLRAIGYQTNGQRGDLMRLVPIDDVVNLSRD